MVLIPIAFFIYLSSIITLLPGSTFVPFTGVCFTTFPVPSVFILNPRPSSILWDSFIVFPFKSGTVTSTGFGFFKYKITFDPTGTSSPGFGKVSYILNPSVFCSPASID